MDKQIGFHYSNNKITKHSESHVKEVEEELDYIRNERFYRIRNSEHKLKQTGSDWNAGLGYFPKPKPVLAEGNTCTTVATTDRSSVMIGLRYGNKDLTPKEGCENSSEEEELTDCPRDPEKPGLRYKRTRKRTVKTKEGDHVSQSSFGIGAHW